ncbi:MAG: hypothetical protein QG653_56 [Patescibacteria group bacterium]|nr:hypothetical protein [Patescibacteria group bacterium]
MNKTKIFFSLLAIGFGVFMVVFGERDDSPGAQFLGLIAVVSGIVGIVRSRKKRWTQQSA